MSTVLESNTTAEAIKAHLQAILEQIDKIDADDLGVALGAMVRHMKLELFDREGFDLEGFDDGALGDATRDSIVREVALNLSSQSGDRFDLFIKDFGGEGPGGQVTWVLYRGLWWELNFTGYGPARWREMRFLRDNGWKTILLPKGATPEPCD